MRLVTACEVGYRLLYLHTVKTSHLNLAVQRASVCVSVWSVGLWHTAALLRRGEGAHDALGFEISEAIHLPAPGWCQQFPRYVQDLCFRLWSRSAAAVCAPQPTCCQAAKRGAS